MTNWKPPSTQQERLTRSVRSMINGTLDGRIVSAMPVKSSTVQSDSEFEDSSDSGVTLLPQSDQFKPGAAETVIFNLTYAPYDDPAMGVDASRRASIHIYWKGLLQYDLSYSLDNRKLVLTDLSSKLRSDDIVTVKYWYDADFPYGVETSGSSEIVNFSGPPTHFYRRNSPHGFYTYEEAISSGSSSEWLDWVIENLAISSSGSISYATPPTGPASGFDFEPAWILPTNGLQCRFSVDDFRYNTTPQFWNISIDFAVATFDYISTSYATFLDLYEWDNLDYSFATSNDDSFGANSKQWDGWYTYNPDNDTYEYDLTQQATEYPAEASVGARANGLDGFQRPPYVSTTPKEYVDNNYLPDEDGRPETQRPYVAFYLKDNFWRPVDHEYTDYTFEMHGIKMIRESS